MVYCKGQAVQSKKVFVCPTDSEVKSCVDIGDGSSVEIVDEFCYLGDMLSVDVDVDAAVTARIHTGWSKFRSLASFLTAKCFPDIVKVVQRNKLRRYGHLKKKKDDDWVKNVLLWRLSESDKEVDPGKHGKSLWTRMWMI